MKCICNEWKENIDKLNAGFVLQHVHGGTGYDGKSFSYCPWCGIELVKERNE